MYKLFTIILLIASTFAYAETQDNFNIRGIELSNQRKYREAIAEFDKAISEHDKASAIAYHNKAWAFELQGDINNAIPNYEEALRRNPKQILTAENLSYLYYKTGNHIKAVSVAELVLNMDPANTQVIKWLPDAYIKKLEQERTLNLVGRDQTGAVNKTIETKSEHPQKRIILEGGFDFMIRAGYFHEENNFKYIKTTGALVNLPETIWINYSPIKAWTFSITAENPRLGLMAPNLLTHQERIESLYNIESISIGMGFLLSHHNSIINNREKYTETDFKTGFLLSHRGRWDMDIKFYPRLFPHDGSQSRGKTMDVSSFEIGWTINRSQYLKYYSLFSFKDFYFFDHTIPQSNWFGVYDIGVGAIIGNKGTSLPVTLMLEYRQRFYIRDIANKDPYSLVPNGQGWFGLNFKKWFYGTPISDVYALGSEVTLRVEEQITPQFALYQALILETGYKNEFGIETSFQFGVRGAIF